jgi:ElaB/YqjD/DUF883 family membrane-anchored ribosome-binding protein
MADTRSTTRNSEEIRRDIDETRSNMDETVTALERKFTPGQVLDDLLDRFRGSESGPALGDTAGSVAKSAGRGLGELFKNHPMPATLTAIGLGWLAMDKMSGGGSRGSSVSAGTHRRGMSAGAPAWEGRGDDGGGLGGRTGQAAEQAQERLGETAERAKQGVSSVVERAGETASQVSERAGEMARHAGEEVREQATRAGQGIASFVEEQPLAAGAILFGAGLAAGLITPSTRWEDETMGRTADTVKEEGRELARGAAEGARAVADEAVETAKEAASERELGADFTRKSREVVSEAGEAARERAEKEGERMSSRTKRAARRTRETAESEID